MPEGTHGDPKGYLRDTGVAVLSSAQDMAMRTQVDGTRGKWTILLLAQTLQLVASLPLDCP